MVLSLQARQGGLATLAVEQEVPLSPSTLSSLGHSCRTRFHTSGKPLLAFAGHLQHLHRPCKARGPVSGQHWGQVFTDGHCPGSLVVTAPAGHCPGPSPAQGSSSSVLWQLWALRGVLLWVAQPVPGSGTPAASLCVSKAPRDAASWGCSLHRQSEKKAQSCTKKLLKCLQRGLIKTFLTAGGFD